jgi:hypothetical protein
MADDKDARAPAQEKGPDIKLLERLEQWKARHRAEVSTIVNALTRLGEEAGVPPSDNIALVLASQYARKLDRLEDFDLEVLEAREAEEEAEEEEQDDEDENEGEG